MHIASWITKAINTCFECVMLIALPLQQGFYKHTSMVCYMYIACPVAGTYGIICYRLQVLALEVKEL